VAIFSHSRDNPGGDDPALGLTAFSAEWDRQFADLPQFEKESIVANPMSDAAQRLHGAVEAALKTKDQKSG
jgi:hypothetical protein